MSQTTMIGLIDRLKRDESDAWQEWVSLYHPFLLRRLLASGEQTADAEDIIQEILQVVQKKIAQFNREENGQKGAFRNWLWKVTTNCRRNYHRTRQSQQRADPQGGSEALGFLAQQVDNSNDLEQEWKQAHQQYLIQHVLDLAKKSVPSETWMVFQRRIIDKIPYEQLIQEMNISLSSAYNRVKRVREFIRLQLSELDEEY